MVIFLYQHAKSRKTLTVIYQDENWEHLKTNFSEIYLFIYKLITMNLQDTLMFEILLQTEEQQRARKFKQHRFSSEKGLAQCSGKTRARKTYLNYSTAIGGPTHTRTF